MNFNNLVGRAQGNLKKEKKLYSEGIWVGLIRLANVALAFGLSVTLARVLGSRQFGIYSQVLAILNIIAAPVELGFPQLIVREVAKYVETKRFELVKGILYWSIWAVVLSSVAFILLYPILKPFGGKNITEEVHSALVWALYLVPIFGLSALFSSGIKGFTKIGIGQLHEMILMPGLLVLAIFGINLFDNIWYDPALVYQIQIVTSGISILIGGGIFWHYYRVTIPPNVGIEYKHKEWFISALSLASVNGVHLVNKWASLLILGIFVKYAELGVYRVALQIALLADFGRMIVNPIIGPQIAKTFAANDHAKLQYYARLSAGWIFLINVFIYGLFIITGNFLIELFFGSEYLAAYNVVMILLAGQVVDSITGSSVLFLTMTGFENNTAIVRFITTTINLTMVYIFSDLWGINGAAIATSITLILWNWIIFWVVKKKLNIYCLPFKISVDVK